MKLGWVSPMPPTESGVAVYSLELLSRLQGRVDVEVFEDGAIDAEMEHRLAQKDLNVYHLGNNAWYHKDAYRLALSHPGLIVLHDSCLHHLIAALTLSVGDVKGYLAECAHSHGAEGLAQGRRNAVFGFDAEKAFDLLLVRTVAETSRGVLVHSDWASRTVRSLCPNAKVFRIPFPVIQWDLIRHSEGQASWPPGIVLPGLVTRPKRPREILAAVCRLRAYDHWPRLIFAGESRVGHMAWVQGLNMGEQLFITGRLTDAEYHQALQEASICVCLRNPSAGETSATVWQCMAHGKPVIVSDTTTYSELPDDAVAKVSVDEREIDELTAVLRALIENPGLARALGRSARAFALQEGDPTRTVAGYEMAFSEVMARS